MRKVLRRAGIDMEIDAPPPLGLQMVRDNGNDDFHFFFHAKKLYIKEVIDKTGHCSIGLSR